MKQLSIDQKVSRLAARQHGVISRAQARQMGFTRGVIAHRIESHRWIALHSDVFRLNGAPVSWRQDLMAACLLWGPDVAVSHRAAARLLDLPGADRCIEVTAPRNRRRRSPPSITVYSNFLPTYDVTQLDGIPVTTPARTILDLASICASDVVEESMDEALRRRLVTTGRLRWRLAKIDGAGKGRSGVKLIRRLLDAREGVVPQSVLETRMLRVLKGAGLPPPELQHRLPEANAVLDFAYPEMLVAIETDGYRWHSGRARWEHDRARGNRLTTLGWRVLHVTWRQLNEQPEAVTAAIAELILEATSRRSAGTL